jgi:nucleoside-diphosphate-sugar epimerase
MRKAIVTGANGFVGSAVCKELVSVGVDVIAVVHKDDGNIKQLGEKVKIVYSELSDYGNLDKYITERDIDIFYHFAWEGSSGNLRADEKVQLSNVKAACDAVRVSALIGCNRFVFAASIMQYEVAETMRLVTKPAINTIYNTAKLTADYMSRAIAGQLEVDYICGLISNIYGPGENSPRLINTSLRKLLKGEHCAFTAGNQMYDFIYITDAAKAFVALGEKGISNKIYYIGSGEPRPLKEFLSEMKDCVDPDIEIGLGEIPSSSTSLSYNEFDINALNADTGFVPLVPFKDGISRTIKWLEEN